MVVGPPERELNVKLSKDVKLDTVKLFRSIVDAHVSA